MIGEKKKEQIKSSSPRGTGQRLPFKRSSILIDNKISGEAEEENWINNLELKKTAAGVMSECSLDAHKKPKKSPQKKEESSESLMHKEALEESQNTKEQRKHSGWLPGAKKG